MNTEKIINKLYKLNIKYEHIITYGICLNAFGLLSLLYGEFLLFIMLFATSIYSNKIYNDYKLKFNVENDIIDIYYNFSDYIKILSTYAIFTKLYHKKIDNNIIAVSLIILIVCNINFTIENILNKNKIKQNNFIKQWIKLLSWIPKKNLEILQSITYYFNEFNVILYFILAMIYIHYK